MNSVPRSFLFSYEFRGAKYSFEVPADSAAEAQARLSRIASAELDGEIKLVIPVPDALGENSHN